MYDLLQVVDLLSSYSTGRSTAVHVPVVTFNASCTAVQVTSMLAPAVQVKGRAILNLSQQVVERASDASDYGTPVRTRTS